MDFHLEDDDSDGAAMAEAMGFSGFGNQRPAKRKFNANADAAVSALPREKKGGNVSKTGANSAPLGVRRPLQLPPPTTPSLPIGAGENTEEIDLDEYESTPPATGGDGSGAADSRAKPKFIDALQSPGGYQSEDADSMVAQPPAPTVVDNGPPGLPSRPPHQQNFRRGQNHQSGRGGRGGSHGAGPTGSSGAPWWEGYYDAKMNENPWERLERERGLQPRGIWVARKADAGHTFVAAVAPPEPWKDGADAAA